MNSSEPVTRKKHASELRIGERYKFHDHAYVVTGNQPLKASFLTPLHDLRGTPGGRSNILPQPGDYVDVLDGI
jgi:hypothetical protein